MRNSLNGKVALITGASMGVVVAVPRIVLRVVVSWTG
jgi:hypothetical protein